VSTIPAIPPARRTALTALLTGAVLVAGAPAARAAWSAPAELDTGVGVSAITVAGDGGRLVVARSTGRGGAINTRLLGVASSGQPQGRRTLAGGAAPPVAYGDDQLVWGRTRSLGTVSRRVPDGKGGTRTVRLPHLRLGLSVGSGPDVVFGPGRFTTTAVLDEPVRLSASPSGDLVLAWSDVGDDGVVRVTAGWRRAGRKRAVRLSDARVVSGSRSSRLLAVATGRTGETVFVYQQGATTKTRRLLVRSLDVRKGRLGKPQTLRRGGPGFPGATAAVGRNGRAVVAWGEQDAASDRREPYVVRATTRNTDGARFATPRPIDRGSTTVRPPGGTIVSAIDRANRPLVAWSQVVGSAADGTAHDLPRVAQGGPTGGLAAAADLAAAGRVHDVAVTRQGATGVVLVREQEVPRGGSNGDRGTAVQIAVRPAGGTIGAPSTIEAFNDQQLLDRSNAYGAAAIGALPSGGFTVAWTRATVVDGKLRSSTVLSDGTP